MLLDLPFHFQDWSLSVVIYKSIDQYGANSKPICDFCLLFVVIMVSSHYVLNLLSFKLVEPPHLLAPRSRWIGPSYVFLLGIKLIESPLLLASGSDWIGPAYILQILLIIQFLLSFLIHHALLVSLHSFPYLDIVISFELSFQISCFLFKLLPNGDSPPRPSMEMWITYPIFIESEFVAISHKFLWVEYVGGSYSIDLSELCWMTSIF